MNILFVEPYYTGSHKQWIEGYATQSSHNVDKIFLPGRHWKWRMHGGAVTLVEEYSTLDKKYDLIICSDMLDVALFRSLGRPSCPVITYFHENQLTYPKSTSDTDNLTGRDNHYAWINYTSALVSDYTFFNSHYHKDIFLRSLASFLRNFPDHQNLNSIEEISAKSQVLHLGLDLLSLDQSSVSNYDIPVILWNHRWEYDKNPDLFFSTLVKLKDAGSKFKLVVCGHSSRSVPDIFHISKEALVDNTIHWEPVTSRGEYAALLGKSDIIPMTSNQDFFGISFVEAVYSGCLPIIPNRLAYLEHFNDTELPIVFHNDNELYVSLKEVIDTWPQKKKSFKDDMIKYDWSVKTIEYDDLFGGFVS